MPLGMLAMEAKRETMTARLSVQWLVSIIAASALASCSGSTRSGYLSDGSTGAQTGDAARDVKGTLGGSGGGAGVGGVTGTGGAGGAASGGSTGHGGASGGSGGSVIDAPIAGEAGSDAPLGGGGSGGSGTGGTTTTCALRGEACAARSCCVPLICSNATGVPTCLESYPPPADSGAEAGSTGGLGGGTGGTGGSGGATGTGGTGGSGGATGTGGTGGSGGATGTGGTGGSGGYAGVDCGGFTCTSGKICCVSQMLAYLSCTPSTSCSDFLVTCDGPEDCGGAGHQCCLPSGALIQTTCTTGSCLAGLAMCHTAADCEQGQTCCPGNLMGYAYSSCQSGTCN